MPPRISNDRFKQITPGIYEAISAFDDAAEAGGIEFVLLELVKLRCSQLNGCAFCVQYHTRHLVEAGMAIDRIALVPAWAETDVFTPREKAALGWGESLTLLAETHASDAAYAEVAAHFSEQEIIGLTAAISVINVWNRISAGLRFDPPYPA